jgi:hypothetical protein
MPSFIFTNTVAAEMRMTLAGQRIENTLYFQREEGWSEAQIEQLGQDLATWWGAELAPVLVDDLSLTEVYLVDRSSDTGPTVTHTDGLPLVGLQATTPPPNNVAFCISFRSAGRGRSSRGRNYVPGIRGNQITDCVLSSGDANAIRDAYQALPTYLTESEVTWVIASQFHNGAPRPSGGLLIPVTTAVYTDRVVDSQRRRLPGRGT